jgi:hypothetical protein
MIAEEDHSKLHHDIRADSKGAIVNSLFERHAFLFAGNNK